MNERSVTLYTIATGVLSLVHTARGQAINDIVAEVDLDLLLSTVKSTDTQIGEWINVIGYVEDADGILGISRAGRKTTIVKVRAIMLWSAGAIRLRQYELALHDRLACDSDQDVHGP